MHVCLGVQHSCSWIVHIAWLLKYKITYLVFIGVLDSDPWWTFEHPCWSWGSGGKLKLSPCQIWTEIITCLHLNRSNVYILWIVMTHFIVQCKVWVCIVRGDLEPSQRNSLKGVISSCKGWNRSGGIAFVRHLQWPTTHSLQIPSLIRSFSKTNGFNGHNGHCLTDSEHLDIVF